MDFSLSYTVAAMFSMSDAEERFLRKEECEMFLIAIQGSSQKIKSDTFKKIIKISLCNRFDFRVFAGHENSAELATGRSHEIFGL